MTPARRRDALLMMLDAQPIARRPMKTLTKDQKRQKATLLAEMRQARDEMLAAWRRYDDAAIELQELATEVMNGLDDFIQAKSETWQESPRGEAYRQWMEQWEEAADVQVPEPDFPDLDVVESLPESFAEAGGA